MARKSRKALWREALRDVSDCPYDIFSILTPQAELIEKIKYAEMGDIDTVTELIEELYHEGKALGNSPTNEALPFWCVKGCELGSIKAAQYLVKCITDMGYNPLLFEKAQRLLYSHDDLTWITDNELKNVGIMYAVERAGIETDPAAVLSLCHSIPEEEFSFERLYILSCALKLGRTDVLDEAQSLALTLGIAPITALPSFFGGETIAGSLGNGSKDFINTLCSVILKWNLEEWRDFWLRCMYEYAVNCLDSDFTGFAQIAAEICLGRTGCQKKHLHALAFIKYLLNAAVADGEHYRMLENECRLLSEKCRFEGLSSDIDDTLPEALKDAVYTRARSERLLSESSKERGVPVIHAKNRYSLTCSLEGHIKRGRKHFWEITICFPKLSDKEKPPVFEPLNIAEARHIVKRGGVSLEQEKGKSQLICFSEVIINGVKHPFTIDLILDIAYVSATKCEEGCIVVKNTIDKDDAYILLCHIFLY